jgi:hypothetical protein
LLCWRSCCQIVFARVAIGAKSFGAHVNLDALEPRLGLLQLTHLSLGRIGGEGLRHPVAQLGCHRLPEIFAPFQFVVNVRTQRVQRCNHAVHVLPEVHGEGKGVRDL